MPNVARLGADDNRERVIGIAANEASLAMTLDRKSRLSQVAAPLGRAPTCAPSDALHYGSARPSSPSLACRIVPRQYVTPPAQTPT